MSKYISKYISICIIYLYIYIYLYLFSLFFMYMNMHILMNVCTYIYAYIYIYICVCVCIIYIYICMGGWYCLKMGYHNLFLQPSERGVLGPQLPLWQLMVVCHLWFWVSAFFASGHWGLQEQLGVNKDMENPLPSGKCLHNYEKSPFLMGKSTINGHVQ